MGFHPNGYVCLYNNLAHGQVLRYMQEGGVTALFAASKFRARSGDAYGMQQDDKGQKKN